MSAQENEKDRFNGLVERMNSEGGSISEEKKYSEEEKEKIIENLNSIYGKTDTKED